MELKTILKKIQGPTLKEQFEAGDIKGIRNTILASWGMFLLVGILIGVELVRRGLVPL